MNTSKLPPLPHWCEEGSPFAQQMQAYALAAIQAQSVPDGWQLVPKEPTQQMLDAGEDTFECAYTGAPTSSPARVWSAMLASAPPAPQASVVQQEQLASAHVVSMDDMQGVVDWLPHQGQPIKVGDYLYTHPAPQAKPQPLSDERKIEMWTQATIEQCSHMACYMRGFEDAEAAHGIKE